MEGLTLAVIRLLFSVVVGLGILTIVNKIINKYSK